MMYTEGPWYIGHDLGDGISIVSDPYPLPTKRWTVIAVAHRSNDIYRKMDIDYKSNARLIAAAPDMLEALEMIAYPNKSFPAGVSIGDLIEIAKSAICKAKGV